jgi:hypothetical protein
MRGDYVCFVDNGEIVDHHCLNFLKDRDTFLSLTNQRSSFEVRRVQHHHQQIKAHGQHMVNKT